MTHNHIVLDDKLALLSLKTAQEVDKRLHGREINPKVLVEFGERLADASGIRDSQETAFLHSDSDPRATEVFSQAIEASSKKTVNDLETLAELLKNIINPLIDKSKRLSDDDLRAIKSFCLAFHRSFVAQTHSMNFEQGTPFSEANGIYR